MPPMAANAMDLAQGTADAAPPQAPVTPPVTPPDAAQAAGDTSSLAPADAPRIEPVAAPAMPGAAPADPMAALLEAGAALLQGLTRARADGGSAPGSAAFEIERDPATGRASVRLPLPDAAVLRQLAQAFEPWLK